MADGFKVADAYVDVVAKVKERDLSSSATAAGDAAGRIIGDTVSKGTVSRMRNNRGQFIGAGKGLGDDAGGGLIKGIAGKGTALAGTLRGLVMSPHALAVVGVAGAALAPALMAGLSGGIMLGAGAGVIGLGYSIVKEEPAVKKASERLGKTVTGIMKRSAAPMVKPFAQAFGLIEGMMKRLEPSFKKAFSAMAPAIVPLTKGFTDLVENAMPGILKLIEASGPFMTEIAPAMGAIGTGISIFAREIAKAGPDAALFFKDLFAWIGGFIAGMGYFIGWVARGYGELRAFFVGIGPFVKNLEAKLSAFWSRVGAWFSGVGASIAGAWGAFTGFFSRLGSSISGFVSGVWGWFAALPGRIGGALSSLWGSVSAWGASVGSWFAALPGRIGAWLASIPGRLRTAFTQAFHAALFAIGYGIGAVLKFFITLPGKVYAAAVGLVSRVRTIFNNTRAAAVSLASNLVSSVRNFFAQLPGRISSAISSIVSRVRSVFTSARSTATSTASSLVTGVINFLRQLPGRAASAISAIGGRIRSIMSSAASSARSSASSLVNGVVGLLRSLPGKAGSAVSSVGSRIAGALRGAIGSARSIGAQIIQGLIGGIKSMIGAAVGAAKSAVGSIVSGAKSALGISSPSKVAEKQVGRWFLPGVSRGVIKSLPKARAQVAQATRALVPGAPGVGSRGAGLSVTRSERGTSYSVGNVVLDLSSMRSLADVVEAVERLGVSARTYRARGVQTGRA